ncbi:MAG: recombinase zinc beta ribbon domain-containing protein [Parcubacteria group bacterium]|nr:recombinase zinc beta ribbon domain-containing protein [Parcubacteria group bacterium]
MDYGEKRQYKGSHESMITEEEYWRAQRMMGRPAPRPQKRQFSYTGIIRCGECGCMVTAEEKTKKSGRVYIYYRCSRRHKTIVCKNPPVPLKELEEQITAQLEKIRIPLRFKDWSLTWLQQTHENEVQDRSVVLATLHKVYEDNQQKLDRLTDMRLKELLTDQEYATKKESLLGEQKNVKEKLADTEQRAMNWLERMEQSFDFAVTAYDKFETGSLAERRDVLTTLGTELTLQNRVLRLELDNLWKIFAKHSKQLYADVKRLELAEDGSTNKKAIDFETMTSLWRVRRDLNPRSSP